MVPHDGRFTKLLSAVEHYNTIFSLGLNSQQNKIQLNNQNHFSNLITWKLTMLSNIKEQANF